MALSNAPIRSTRADRELFIGRAAELRELDRCVEQRWNALLTGPAGVGKTSLLLRYMDQLEARPGDALPVLVPGRPTSSHDFVVLAREHLERALAAHGVDGPDAGAWRTRPSEGAPTADVLRELSALGELARSAWRVNKLRVVFLVDELDSPDVAYAVFGRMRDELWSIDAQWIVTARPQDLGILLAPPADAFFERRIDLSVFEPDEAHAFVRTRLAAEGIEAGDTTVQWVAELGAGHPVAMLSLLREIAADGGQALEHRARSVNARAQDLSDTLEQLTEPARRLATAIRHRDVPVSATDRDLQAELGVSAGRLRQLFRELENAQVLVAGRAETTRPGRPSKAYRLRLTHGSARRT